MSVVHWYMYWSVNQLHSSPFVPLLLPLPSRSYFDQLMQEFTPTPESPLTPSSSGGDLGSINEDKEEDNVFVVESDSSNTVWGCESVRGWEVRMGGCEGGDTVWRGEMKTYSF